MTTITLPWPPSVNHYWRMWRGRMLISRRGRAYRAQVGAIVSAAGIKPLSGPLAVYVELYPPDRRIRDVDNTLKGIGDSIQHGGAFHDDSQIVWLLVHKLDVVAGGKAIVRIAEIPPDTVIIRRFPPWDPNGSAQTAPLPRRTERMKRPKTRRIYISGPMTGHADCNFAAFHAAAKRLSAAGWKVFNPADNFGGRKDLPRETYLRLDLAMLSQCDAIAMLPGWQDSRGAKLEYVVAHELGCAVIDAVTLLPLENAPAPTIGLHRTRRAEPVHESILDEAKCITEGDRRAEYGAPADDFARAAQMWTGILTRKLRDGQRITAMDIPLCMVAVKLARQSHHHKRDNLVDIAGYARTAAMVAGEE